MELREDFGTDEVGLIDDDHRSEFFLADTLQLILYGFKEFGAGVRYLGTSQLQRDLP
jgi:hypothetical protein